MLHPHMASLNIRNVPEAQMERLRKGASVAGVTLRQYCLERLLGEHEVAEGRYAEYAKFTPDPEIDGILASKTPDKPRIPQEPSAAVAKREVSAFAVAKPRSDKAGKREHVKGCRVYGCLSCRDYGVKDKARGI